MKCLFDCVIVFKKTKLRYGVESLFNDLSKFNAEISLNTLCMNLISMWLHILIFLIIRRYCNEFEDIFCIVTFKHAPIKLKNKNNTN